MNAIFEVREVTSLAERYLQEHSSAWLACVVEAPDSLFAVSPERAGEYCMELSIAVWLSNGKDAIRIFNVDSKPKV